MEKVKVTQEIADAYNEFIKDYRDTERALKALLNLRETISWENPLKSLGTDLLLQMFVNGYEVEKTPEQKLAEVYRYYRNEAYTTDMTAYADGIERALDTLGIRIEGVNA